MGYSKRCRWGRCDSNNQNKMPGEGVFFVPFPKPKNNLDKCLRWIHLCGGPNKELDLHTIKRWTCVCSKHFVGGKGPTKKHPDPFGQDTSLLDIAAWEEDRQKAQSSTGGLLDRADPPPGHANLSNPLTTGEPMIPHHPDPLHDPLQSPAPQSRYHPVAVINNSGSPNDQPLAETSPSISEPPIFGRDNDKENQHDAQPNAAITWGNHEKGNPWPGVVNSQNRLEENNIHLRSMRDFFARTKRFPDRFPAPRMAFPGPHNLCHLPRPEAIQHLTGPGNFLHHPAFQHCWPRFGGHLQQLNSRSASFHASSNEPTLVDQYNVFNVRPHDRNQPRASSDQATWHSVHPHPTGPPSYGPQLRNTDLTNLRSQHRQFSIPTPSSHQSRPLHDDPFGSLQNTVTPDALQYLHNQRLMRPHEEVISVQQDMFETTDKTAQVIRIEPVESNVINISPIPEDVQLNQHVTHPAVMDTYLPDVNDSTQTRTDVFGMVRTTKMDVKENIEYFCNFCMKKCDDEQYFLKHIASHLFICGLCRFQTFSRVSLLNHLRTSHGCDENSLGVLQTLYLDDLQVNLTNDFKAHCFDLSKPERWSNILSGDDIRQEVQKDPIRHKVRAEQTPVIILDPDDSTSGCQRMSEDRQTQTTSGGHDTSDSHMVELTGTKNHVDCNNNDSINVLVKGGNLELSKMPHQSSLELEREIPVKSKMANEVAEETSDCEVLAESVHTCSDASEKTVPKHLPGSTSNGDMESIDLGPLEDGDCGKRTPANYDMSTLLLCTNDETLRDKCLNSEVVADLDPDSQTPVTSDRNEVGKLVPGNKDICYYCDFSGDPLSLSKHECGHVQLNAYSLESFCIVCPYCSKEMASVEFTRQHIEEFHPEKPVYIVYGIGASYVPMFYFCSLCPYARHQSDHRSVLNHIQLHTPNMQNIQVFRSASKNLGTVLVSLWRRAFASEKNGMPYVRLSKMWRTKIWKHSTQRTSRCSTYVSRRGPSITSSGEIEKSRTSTPVLLELEEGSAQSAPGVAPKSSSTDNMGSLNAEACSQESTPCFDQTDGSSSVGQGNSQRGSVLPLATSSDAVISPSIHINAEAQITDEGTHVLESEEDIPDTEVGDILQAAPMDESMGSATPCISVRADDSNEEVESSMVEELLQLAGISAQHSQLVEKPSDVSPSSVKMDVQEAFGVPKIAGLIKLSCTEMPVTSTGVQERISGHTILSSGDRNVEGLLNTSANVSTVCPERAHPIISSMLQCSSLTGTHHPSTDMMESAPATVPSTSTESVTDSDRRKDSQLSSDMRQSLLPPEKVVSQPQSNTICTVTQVVACANSPNSLLKRMGMPSSAAKIYQSSAERASDISVPSVATRLLSNIITTVQTPVRLSPQRGVDTEKTLACPVYQPSLQYRPSQDVDKTADSPLSRGPCLSRAELMEIDAISQSCTITSNLAAVSPVPPSPLFDGVAVASPTRKPAEMKDLSIETIKPVVSLGELWPVIQSLDHTVPSTIGMQYTSSSTVCHPVVESMEFTISGIDATMPTDNFAVSESGNSSVSESIIQQMELMVSSVGDTEWTVTSSEAEPSSQSPALRVSDTDAIKLTATMDSSVRSDRVEPHGSEAGNSDFEDGSSYEQPSESLFDNSSPQCIITSDHTQSVATDPEKAAFTPGTGQSGEHRASAEAIVSLAETCPISSLGMSEMSRSETLSGKEKNEKFVWVCPLCDRKDLSARLMGRHFAYVHHTYLRQTKIYFMKKPMAKINTNLEMHHILSGKKKAKLSLLKLEDLPKLSSLFENMGRKFVPRIEQNQKRIMDTDSTSVDSDKDQPAVESSSDNATCDSDNVQSDTQSSTSNTDFSSKESPSKGYAPPAHSCRGRLVIQSYTRKGPKSSCKGSVRCSPLQSASEDPESDSFGTISDIETHQGSAKEAQTIPDDVLALPLVPPASMGSVHQPTDELPSRFLTPPSLELSKDSLGVGTSSRSDDVCSIQKATEDDELNASIVTSSADHKTDSSVANIAAAIGAGVLTTKIGTNTASNRPTTSVQATDDTSDVPENSIAFTVPLASTVEGTQVMQTLSHDERPGSCDFTPENLSVVTPVTDEPSPESDDDIFAPNPLQASENSLICHDLPVSPSLLLNQVAIDSSASCTAHHMPSHPEDSLFSTLQAVSGNSCDTTSGDARDDRLPFIEMPRRVPDEGGDLKVTHKMSTHEVDSLSEAVNGDIAPCNGQDCISSTVADSTPVKMSCLSEEEGSYNEIESDITISNSAEKDAEAGADDLVDLTRTKKSELLASRSSSDSNLDEKNIEEENAIPDEIMPALVREEDEPSQAIGHQVENQWRNVWGKGEDRDLHCDETADMPQLEDARASFERDICPITKTIDEIVTLCEAKDSVCVNNDACPYLDGPPAAKKYKFDSTDSKLSSSSMEKEQTDVFDDDLLNTNGTDMDTCIEPINSAQQSILIEGNLKADMVVTKNIVTTSVSSNRQVFRSQILGSIEIVGDGLRTATSGAYVANHPSPSSAFDSDSEFAVTTTCQDGNQPSSEPLVPFQCSVPGISIDRIVQESNDETSSVSDVDLSSVGPRSKCQKPFEGHRLPVKDKRTVWICPHCKRRDTSQRLMANHVSYVHRNFCKSFVQLQRKEERSKLNRADEIKRILRGRRRPIVSLFRIKTHVSPERRLSQRVGKCTNFDYHRLYHTTDSGDFVCDCCDYINTKKASIVAHCGHHLR